MANPTGINQYTAVGSHVKISKSGKSKGRTGTILSTSKTGVHKIAFSTTREVKSFHDKYVSMGTKISL